MSFLLTHGKEQHFADVLSDEYLIRPLAAKTTSRGLSDWQWFERVTLIIFGNVSLLRLARSKIEHKPTYPK